MLDAYAPQHGPSPCGSDASDMSPRRLRYSEEVLPLHFFDQAVGAGAPAATRGCRPLRVYARLKPAVGADAAPAAAAPAAAATEGGAGGLGGGGEPLLQVSGGEVVQRARGGGSEAYAFTRVFQGSEQEEFFGCAVEPLLSDLVGLHTASGVFMAYGASGTGKSYTMQGTAAQPGMVPLTLNRLYQMLAQSGRPHPHQVQLCYYEVYENRVYDLLHSARLGRRQERHLPIQVLGASCCVPGLLRCHCASADAGLRLFAAATRIRKQAATGVNAESSRSHAVFTVQVLEVDEAGAMTGRSATLSLVDLAGAERATRTKHVGSKLRESAGINASLSVLGRCLDALRHNQALALRAQPQPQPLSQPAATAAAPAPAFNLSTTAPAATQPSASAPAAPAPSAAAGGGPPAAAGGGPSAAAGGVPRVIPVRESSLTTLFKGVLTGQGGSLVLSVHLSQAAAEADTNRHTLRFGALAARLHLVAAPPVAPPAAAAGGGGSGAGAGGKQAKQAARAGAGGGGGGARLGARVVSPIAEEVEEGAAGGEEHGSGGGGRGTAGAAAVRQAGQAEEADGAAEAGQQLQEEEEQQQLEEAEAGGRGGRQELLVEELRARVEALQQRLARAEEEARAAVACEWEALVAAGREELEEAQARAAEVEARAASLQKELAAERAARQALAQQLQEALAARPPDPQPHSRPQLPGQLNHEPCAAAGAAHGAGAGSVQPGGQPRLGPAHPPGPQTAPEGEPVHAAAAGQPGGGGAAAAGGREGGAEGGASAGRADAEGPCTSGRGHRAPLAEVDGNGGDAGCGGRGAEGTGPAGPAAAGQAQELGQCGRMGKRRRLQEEGGAQGAEELGSGKERRLESAWGRGAAAVAGPAVGDAVAGAAAQAGSGGAAGPLGVTPVAGRTRRKRQAGRR